MSANIKTAAERLLDLVGQKIHHEQYTLPEQNHGHFVVEVPFSELGLGRRTEEAELRHIQDIANASIHGFMHRRPSILTGKEHGVPIKYRMSFESITQMQEYKGKLPAILQHVQAVSDEHLRIIARAKPDLSPAM